MKSFKTCCVPICLNTTELTKDTVIYYRFPFDKNIKQKWLEAMHWSDGKPKRNDYVCSEHFEANDLKSIDANTTLVPTIFNSNLSIKQETELSDHEQFLGGKYILNSVKKEIVTKIDKKIYCGPYEILNPLNQSTEQIEIPQSKRRKLGDNITTKRYKRQIGMDTVISNDDAVKSLKDRSDIATTTCANDLPIQQMLPQWQDNETREFLMCLSKHKDEFIRRRNNKFEKIFDELKNLNVLNQSESVAPLIDKWKHLINDYEHSLSNLNLQSDFPFAKEINEILLDSLESDRHSISIGLYSSLQAGSKLSYINDKLELVNKRAVLLKKIEERELKNNLLRKMLNDPPVN